MEANDRSEIVEKILSGARWSSMFRFIAQLVSWISTIIVVRYIAPEEYGLNSMLEASSALLLLFSTLGLDAALARSRTIDQDELRSAFGLLLVVNGVVFISYYSSSHLIAVYFNQPRLEDVVKALSFVFLLVPFRVIPNALLDRELKFKLAALTELIATILAAASTLVLAIMGMGVWALVIGVLVNRVLLTVILMFMQPWFVMPAINLSALRQKMSFAGATSLARLLVILCDSLAALVAGPVIGAAKLGLFSIALQFAVLPLSKVMPVINPIIFPAFSKFQDQRDIVSHYLARALGLVSLVLFPIMLGLSCISHEFVSVVFGEGWKDAALPLALLSLVMPFRLVTSVVRPVLSGIGRIDLALISILVTLCVLLPAIYIGRSYDVIGIVLAIFVVEPMCMIITLILAQRAIEGTSLMIFKNMLPAIVSTSVMVTSVLLIKIVLVIPGEMMRMLVEIGVGVVVYYLSLKLIFEEYWKNAIGLLMGRDPNKYA